MPDSVNTQTNVWLIPESNIPIPETNIPNLHDPKIQGLLEYFSKEIQENKITEAEIVPVVQCLDLSELNLHDIYEIVHGIFCFCFLPTYVLIFNLFNSYKINFTPFR